MLALDAPRGGGPGERRLPGAMPCLAGFNAHAGERPRNGPRSHPGSGSRARVRVGGPGGSALRPTWTGARGSRALLGYGERAAQNPARLTVAPLSGKAINGGNPWAATFTRPAVIKRLPSGSGTM